MQYKLAVTRGLTAITLATLAISGCSGDSEPASPGGQNNTSTGNNMSGNNAMMTTPTNNMMTTGNNTTSTTPGNNMTNPPPPMFDMNNTTPPPSDMGMMGDDMGSTPPGDMGMPEDMGPPPEPECGNGMVEDGETCDGDCSTDCDDNNACTMDTVSGSPMMCDVVCNNVEVISTCGPADDCCPGGCQIGDDPDCTIDNVDCTDPSTWPTDWTALEDEVIAAVNMNRSMGGTCGAMSFPAGTASLTVSSELREAARCHALDMMKRDYFDSASPEGDRVGERVQATGYSYSSVGQDIGAGRATSALQIESWLGREGSCVHMLDPKFDEIGVGYAFGEMSMYKHYWVQVIADKP